MREAKAASALHHPNIVTIYDISSDGDIDYIAVELIGGRTLEDVLSGGRLGLHEALRCATQIAGALAAAHAAGIVHRDLKPGNIMIQRAWGYQGSRFRAGETGGPRIAEGEARRRRCRAATRVGALLGSAPYMSPEQAKWRNVDSR